LADVFIDDIGFGTRKRTDQGPGRKQGGTRLATWVQFAAAQTAASAFLARLLAETVRHVHELSDVHNIVNITVCVNNAGHRVRRWGCLAITARR